MLATKENASKLSILSVFVLLVMKIVASILTGSIAILADALHSLIDLTGVIIGYIGIKVAAKPPDEGHAFGHGKAENIASGIIAVLIMVAAGVIFYQSIQRLIIGGAVEMVTVGIYITAAALVVNGLVSWYAFRVARRTESLALEATARDMFADMLSSVAVLVGLIIMRLTGIVSLDAIVALGVSIIIARTAYVTIRKSIGGLMDTSLPAEEENIIISCITEHSHEIVGFHEVRTRKAGDRRFIDLHLMMPKHIKLEQAHRMCDHIEEDVKSKLANSSITIHLEPCDINCEECLVTRCSLRKIKA